MCLFWVQAHPGYPGLKGCNMVVVVKRVINITEKYFNFHIHLNICKFSGCVVTVMITDYWFLLNQLWKKFHEYLTIFIGKLVSVN